MCSGVVTSPVFTGPLFGQSEIFYFAKVKLVTIGDKIRASAGPIYIQRDTSIPTYLPTTENLYSPVVKLEAGTKGWASWL